MDQLVSDLKLLSFVAGLIGTAAITIWRVNSLSKDVEALKEEQASTMRWRQRVNTILSANGIHVPEDDS